MHFQCQRHQRQHQVLVILGWNYLRWISKGGASSAFVLDMQARIFGKTNLIIIGNDNVVNSSAIKRYEKAGFLLADYMRSLGGVQNTRTINCRDGRNGNQTISCGSSMIAEEIHRYAAYPIGNRLSGLYWFGHGTDSGYPTFANGGAANTGVPWIPQYSVPSFENNAVFATFACHGGVDDGLKAFGSAFGTKLIGNKLFTGAIGLQQKDGKWEVAAGVQSIEDVVFLSVAKEESENVRRASLGGRRTITPKEPYRFVLAIPHLNTETGVISLEKSDYALEDFPIFKEGSNLNFPER